MNETAANPNEQTIFSETKKPVTRTKKVTPKKKAKTANENTTQTRGDLKQSDLVKWSVFVRPEVRNAVRIAAKKAGITDTAWMDAKLWEAAKADLSRKPQAPVKPEDVSDILKQFTEIMQANQEAAQAAQAAIVKEQGAQIVELKQIVEQVAAKPPTTFKEMLFGKSKKPQQGD